MNVLEKILEEIDNHAIEFETFGMCDDYVSVGWAKEIIRSHMDDGSDGWIPCSERLPEDKGWYHCTCSDKEIWSKDIVRQLYYYPELKQFVDNIRYENNGLREIEKFFWTKYITAWKRLPEPYKTGQNSTK